MNTPVYIVIYLVIAVTLLSTIYVSITGQQSGSNDTGKNDNNHLAKYRRTIELDPVGGNSSFNSNETVSKSNEYMKRDYLSLDNQSGLDIIGLPAFWNDPFGSCGTVFTCGINSTDGWDDKQSFQLSTTKNTNNTWSSIKGREIDVKPGELVQLVSHMKLNDWATKSHVVFEGLNETSEQWYQIKQCPKGLNGPLEWQEFRCSDTIPENTSEIRPVLNAGWSSQPNKEGTTWFGSVSIITERTTRFDSVSMINRTTRFDSVSMIKDSPFVTDPNLKVEVLYEGLKHPTSMAFLGQDDILVLEKDNGTVRRIVNGTILSEPLLDVPVASRAERGMLGIAIARHETDHRIYVFLYYTESETGRDGDGDGLRNRLYRYEFVNNTLVKPKLLLDLPEGFYHNGGRILIGPDKYLYITIGEMDSPSLAHERNKALNNQSRHADEPDGRGGILRIDQNGQPIGTHGILGDEEPLNKYYAYGIRNSFGMDFDPLTGKLWDTENGPYFGDEINLVDPGFNSGWRSVQGIWTVADGKKGIEDKGALASEKPDNLVDFNGKGKYSSPEFTWSNTVGPTGLKFLSTDKLGKKYENDMLVADVSYGRIYHFKLNQNRTELLLQDSLIDKVANNDKEISDVLFAQGFDSGRDQARFGITDMKIGPDGYLYVLAYGEGKIYRIVPANPKPDILH